MGDPLSFISEDGWAYPDDDGQDEPTDPVDLSSEVDDDLVALHALGRDAVIDLSDAERRAITYRFGFDGQPPRTLAQLYEHLHAELGMSRSETRLCLDEGLSKLRAQFDIPPTPPVL